MYTLVGPDGVTYPDVANVREFARQHGISPEGLHCVTRGRCRTYKGWYLAGRGPKTFALRDPSGQIHAGIVGLKAFCREHGLQYKAAHKVVAGTNTSHKGWTRA